MSRRHCQAPDEWTELLARLAVGGRHRDDIEASERSRNREPTVDPEAGLLCMSEPRVDDIESLILRALADHLLTTLASNSSFRDLPEADIAEAVEADASDPGLEHAAEDDVAVALDALAADDASIDQALWSLVRQDWRRGAPPVGDNVH